MIIRYGYMRIIERSVRMHWQYI